MLFRSPDHLEQYEIELIHVTSLQGLFSHAAPSLGQARDWWRRMVGGYRADTEAGAWDKPGGSQDLGTWSVGHPEGIPWVSLPFPRGIHQAAGASPETLPNIDNAGGSAIRVESHFSRRMSSECKYGWLAGPFRLLKGAGFRARFQSRQVRVRLCAC